METFKENSWGLMLLAALLQEEALQDKHTEVVCEGFHVENQINVER